MSTCVSHLRALLGSPVWNYHDTIIDARVGVGGTLASAAVRVLPCFLTPAPVAPVNGGCCAFLVRAAAGISGAPSSWAFQCPGTSSIAVSADGAGRHPGSRIALYTIKTCVSASIAAARLSKTCLPRSQFPTLTHLVPPPCHSFQLQPSTHLHGPKRPKPEQSLREGVVEGVTLLAVLLLLVVVVVSPSPSPSRWH
jgi:hypothetical protein